MSNPQRSIEEVRTTLPNHSAAQVLAIALVEQRLAACVQITGPILSVYRWQGVVTQDQEFALSCKTSSSRLSQLVDYLTTHHPYEQPEILIQSFRSMPGYSQWLHDQVEPVLEH